MPDDFGYQAYEARYAAAARQGLPALNPHTLPPDLRRLLRSGQIPAHGVVIDAGCGEGFDSVALGQLGFQVHAVDCSATAIDLAQTLNPHPRVNYTIADLFDWQPGFWADLVIDFGCMHLLNSPADRAAYLTSIWTLLRPRGLFYLRHAAPGDDATTPGDPVTFRARVGADSAEAMIPACPPVATRTVHQCSAEIAAAGFSVQCAARMTPGQLYPVEAAVVARKAGSACAR